MQSKFEFGAENTYYLARNYEPAGGHGLPAEVAVHLGDLVLVHELQLRLHALPSVQDVLLQQVLQIEKTC